MRLETFDDPRQRSVVFRVVDLRRIYCSVSASLCELARSDFLMTSANGERTVAILITSNTRLRKWNGRDSESRWPAVDTVLRGIDITKGNCLCS